jgi:hypothetical protein
MDGINAAATPGARPDSASRRKNNIPDIAKRGNL